MRETPSRRGFLKTSAAAAAAMGLPGSALAQSATKPKRSYGISLAGWSLHRSIGEGEAKRPMLEMPKMAREDFGIEAIELVSPMLASTEPAYLAEFKANAAAQEVRILLIMVDGQGNIGHATERHRERAVASHKKWVDIAADFGCHSIRMNWGGAKNNTLDDPAELDDFIQRSAPHFRKLCEYGEEKNINILIENHWGPSSYPEIVDRLVAAIDHPRFGTLPDFGNFPEEIDKYDAIDSLMKHAKAVSAKCYDFDDATGEETKIDFERMLSIVCDKHGYEGYIGIEYEGNRLSEAEGIVACRKLLAKLSG